MGCTRFFMPLPPILHAWQQKVVKPPPFFGGKTVDDDQSAGGKNQQHGQPHELFQRPADRHDIFYTGKRHGFAGIIDNAAARHQFAVHNACLLYTSKMGKGVTMSADEIILLRDLLNEIDL